MSGGYDPFHERISLAEPLETRRGHIARYHLAAGWLHDGDLVYDATCGVGYGRAILEARGWIRYKGVDRSLEYLEVPNDDGAFEAHDLETWGGPEARPDVVVGFETLEHLVDPGAYIAWTSKARLLFLSIPLYPTAHENPHHKHDYTVHDIERFYSGMRQVAYLFQPAEQSGIWVLSTDG